MTGDDHVLARDLAGQAGSGCSSCAPRAATRTCCARPATGCRTSSSPPRWPAGARTTRCSPRRAPTTPRGSAPRRVWIVDPLDGTREFGEPGRTDWAVHVALWERGASDLTAGAVALPAQDRVLSTRRAAAVPLPRARRRRPPRLRVAVSRTRPPQLRSEYLPSLIGADLVPMGSAGAKIAAVVSGEVDAYVHGGGQYEWDSAAPVAVARAAGLHASRIDGSALAYNQADLLCRISWCCRPARSPRLLAAVRSDPRKSPMRP